MDVNGCSWDNLRWVETTVILLSFAVNGIIYVHLPRFCLAGYLRLAPRIGL